MRWFATAGLAGALLVAACSEAGEKASDPVPPLPTDSSSSPGEHGGESLACGAAVAHDVDVPTDYETLLDVVALPTDKSAPNALQANHFENDPPPNYFAKTGLVVRAGMAFSLAVDQPEGRAVIGWGSPPAFKPVISTEGCDGDGWMAFAGGFRVDEPGCVQLTVRADGNQQSVRVGVGAPCGGQQPPPSP